MSAAGRLPILLYHGFDTSSSAIAIAPALFAWQMRWLNEHAYRVIPLSDVVDRVAARQALPAHAVVITFDDGFESVHRHAFPVLARYGFPATIFVVPGYCDGSNEWPGQPPGMPRRPLLTWRQIREMSHHGFTVGAHSISHPRLDRLAGDELQREVIAAKSLIEDQVGSRVEFFAYPYGRVTPMVRAMVGQAYRGACTARPRLIDSRSDVFALERIDVHYLRGRALFPILAGRALPAYLTARRSLRAAGTLILRRPWQ